MSGKDEQQKRSRQLIYRISDTWQQWTTRAPNLSRGIGGGDDKRKIWKQPKCGGKQKDLICIETKDRKYCVSKGCLQGYKFKGLMDDRVPLTVYASRKGEPKERRFVLQISLSAHETKFNETDLKEQRKQVKRTRKMSKRDIGPPYVDSWHCNCDNNIDCSIARMTSKTDGITYDSPQLFVIVTEAWGIPLSQYIETTPIGDTERKWINNQIVNLDRLIRKNKYYIRRMSAERILIDAEDEELRFFDFRDMGRVGDNVSTAIDANGVQLSEKDVIPVISRRKEAKQTDIKSDVSQPTKPLTDKETLLYVWDNRGGFYGGNAEGTYASRLPDGTPVAVTDRRVSKEEDGSSNLPYLKEMRTTLLQLSDEGKFVQIKAIGFVDKPETSKTHAWHSLIIVMEDFHYGPDGKPALSFGNGRDLYALKDLPRDQKVQIRDQMIQLLLLHPDGHPLNVVWRKLLDKDGGPYLYRVEIKLVDPFGKIQSMKEQTKLLASPVNDPKVGPFWKQYYPWWQKIYFDKQLGLLEEKQTGGSIMIEFMGSRRKINKGGITTSRYTKLPPLPLPTSPIEFEHMIMKHHKKTRLQRLIWWWNKIAQLYTMEFIPQRIVLVQWLKNLPPKEGRLLASCLLEHARSSSSHYYDGLRSSIEEGPPPQIKRLPDAECRLDGGRMTTKGKGNIIIDPVDSTQEQKRMIWFGNIEQATLQNTDYRHVLHTGQHSQLVLMDVLPGQRVGPERHETVDQFIRVEDGQGTFQWKITKDEPWNTNVIQNNSAIFVPAGTWHEFAADANVSKPLKVYTLYSPPEHAPGTVEHLQIE